MKITYRISPGKQFEYIEKQEEGDFSDDTIAAKYNSLSNVFKSGEGLPEAEFDAFIQRQISGESNDVNDWEKMSKEQQKFVQVNMHLTRCNFAGIKQFFNQITYFIHASVCLFN